MLGFDLDREEPASRRQRASHADRRVAAQRSDLEHASRADGREQHLQQPAFVSRDGDRRKSGAVGFLPQRRKDLVLCAEQSCDVVPSSI
jgi:hypothetical protein